MAYELPAICPVCHERFNVKQLGCDVCGSVLEGNFELNRLSRLPREMQQFVITFLKCRGNIREMEKILEVSYPTVRARIDEIVAALSAKSAHGAAGGDADTDEYDVSGRFGGGGDRGRYPIREPDSDHSGEDEYVAEAYGAEGRGAEGYGVDGYGSEGGGADGGGEEGYGAEEHGAIPEAPTRLQILSMLSNGEIGVEEARKMLGRRL
jgi:hypothetical protein